MTKVKLASGMVDHIIREAQEFEDSLGKHQRDGSVGAKPGKPEFNPLDPTI